MSTPTIDKGEVLSTANKNFTARLYQALFDLSAKENLIFSPFSLHAVLGMVALGAKGDTRTEMFEGLEFKKKTDSDIIAKGYNSIITGFQKKASAETFTLLTANRVYSGKDFGPNPEFVKILKTHFKADFEQLDFSNRKTCQVAANKINKWVEDTTKSKIKNIISADALNSDTSLVLVNGIYFKGFWRYKFSKTRTSKKPFHVNLKKIVNVDMMQNQQKFPYGKLPKLKAQAVALSYRGGRLSMVIIRPDNVDGLDIINNNIGSILKDGKSIVKDCLTTTYKVNLSLPKFRVEATLGDLEDVLTEDLGMASMFDEEEADFGGISNKQSTSVYVSSVVQKSFIEVNEEGAEAAAASAVRVTLSKGPGGPRVTIIPFVVDRPFYFQIVDHANGELVLFSGHVNNPSL